MLLTQPLAWFQGWRHTTPGRTYLCACATYVLELSSATLFLGLVANDSGRCRFWSGYDLGPNFLPGADAWFALWDPPADLLMPPDGDFVIPKHLRKHHGTKAEHLKAFRRRLADILGEPKS